MNPSTHIDAGAVCCGLDFLDRAMRFGTVPRQRSVDTSRAEAQEIKDCATKISHINLATRSFNHMEEKIMIDSLILIEGNIVNEDELKISLGNAKQLIVGSVIGFGVVLHLAATSPADFSEALRDFSQIPGVTSVMTLVIRNQPVMGSRVLDLQSSMARCRCRGIWTTSRFDSGANP